MSYRVCILCNGVCGELGHKVIEWDVYISRPCREMNHDGINPNDLTILKSAGVSEEKITYNDNGFIVIPD